MGNSETKCDSSDEERRQKEIQEYWENRQIESEKERQREIEKKREEEEERKNEYWRYQEEMRRREQDNYNPDKYN
ncbi:unnamed protein product [Paramecium sonneborni]|uniref:Uncharacterized protein n=1 Tax=Paramecium sonneborni TaxID=65129 RepID=A0A8S1R446_9CILI|nr:unnamed protein product [Paramecium sonneborni]